jgi:hypothetical protein
MALQAAEKLRFVSGHDFVGPEIIENMMGFRVCVRAFSEG